MNMKKFAMFLLMVVLSISFVACGSDTTTNTETNGTTETAEQDVQEAKFEEVVFVDDENCTFKITGVNADSMWGYTLDVNLDNKSDKNLMFAAEDVSVNGYMCDPFWATTVQAGKKAKSEINFFKENLTELGIEDVEEIEFTLRVYDEDDIFAAELVNETFTFNP